MKESFRHFRDGYIRFVEKQGFPVIVAVCVAVITATALFARKDNAAYVSPTPPVMEHVSAAQLLQQSLANAAKVTPSPTAGPVRWAAPLDSIDELRGFDADTFIQYDSGVWAIHDAVDLKASAGAKVYAIGDGEIVAAGNDDIRGAWLTVRHADSIETHYAGMALLNDYIPGDDVRKGDVIGYCGNAMLDESSLGPHLHLRVTKDGQAMIPSALWQSEISPSH